MMADASALPTKLASGIVGLEGASPQKIVDKNIKPKKREPESNTPVRLDGEPRSGERF